METILGAAPFGGLRVRFPSPQGSIAINLRSGFAYGNQLLHGQSLACRAASVSPDSHACAPGRSAADSTLERDEMQIPAQVIASNGFRFTANPAALQPKDAARTHVNASVIPWCSHSGTLIVSARREPKIGDQGCATRQIHMGGVTPQNPGPPSIVRQ